jgi:hypothetical protein
MNRTGHVVARIISNSLEIGYVVSEEVVDSWLYLDIHWLYSPRRDGASSWGSTPISKGSTERNRVDEVVFISPDKIASAVVKASYRGSTIKNK